MTADQTTYAFKGSYFWPVGDQGAFTGALKISQFWEGLEDDIDAGYTRHYDGLTFIFKGSRFVFDRSVSLCILPGPVYMAKKNSLVETFYSTQSELVIAKGCSIIGRSR